MTAAVCVDLDGTLVRYERSFDAVVAATLTDHHGLADLVDATVVSYEVGGHKTDGDPYEAVRDRLAADEYVMVGDSYAADVEAAREAGFVPVHYEDEGPDLFAVLKAFL